MGARLLPPGMLKRITVMSVANDVLQYLNGKAAYVENIWTVINWKTAEDRFNGSRDEAFTLLKASM